MDISFDHCVNAKARYGRTAPVQENVISRPSSVKQLNKEWPHRTAAVYNRSLRKTAVVFHKASEVSQHPVVDCYGFGFSLETVEKSQPSNRQGYEECPRFR